MPTLTTGVIKSMRVPESFSEHTEERGGLGPDNWTHTYHPPSNQSLEITVRYSGFPTHPSAAASFRKMLAAPHIIYEFANAQLSGQQNIDAAASIAIALGNSGDNQTSNKKTGFEGPTFRMEKLQVMHINGRNVIRLRGWFHKPPSEQARTFLDCIFVDAEPKSSECRIEQLYLQSESAQQFEQSLPEFEKTLQSIVWSN